MNKNERHNKILEIISTKEINTQEELVNALNSYKFNVTQATVSRDVKELGLFKVAGKIKRYKYAYEKKAVDIEEFKLLHLFKNCVVSIDLAKNIVVVKTLGGNGNSAGVMIDKLKLTQVVGSVAGDDTVIIVTKSDEDAIEVKNRLSELL